MAKDSTRTFSHARGGVGARTLLGAPGIATRSKEPCYQEQRASLRTEQGCYRNKGQYEGLKGFRFDTGLTTFADTVPRFFRFVCLESMLVVA